MVGLVAHVRLCKLLEGDKLEKEMINMLNMKYSNNDNTYSVDFNIISDNIVELIGDFPIQTDGFVLSRENMNDDWDYSGFTTVYREINGGCQFSNDGSVYVEPIPHEPTLQELQELKVSEMNNVQQLTIQNGVDVTLSDGNIEHFTLTEHDQTSLMGLQTQVVLGSEAIPWHTSDQTEHCKFYSNADMSLITSAALSYVTWHVTYFRDLRIYIRSLQTKEEVESVFYGMDIPEEYQSEPLKAMIVEEDIQ